MTRTDVAQSEARLAAGAVAGADRGSESEGLAGRPIAASIGVEPVNLRAGMPVDRLSPRTLDGAIDSGAASIRRSRPRSTPSTPRSLPVKVAEGALYPTVTLEGSVQQALGSSQPGSTDQLTGTVLGRVAVPIYQGGAEYSLIRQAKETLGQRRIELDVQRDQVRADRRAGLGPARGDQGADHRRAGAGDARPRSR